MGARDLLFMRPPVPDLAGRSVFVTGAAGGIGRALAVAAAAAGARVAITDLDRAGLRETEQLIDADGGTVLDASAGDITDHEWVDTLAGRIIDRHGVIDVVCNVAGVSAWGTVENLSHDTWRRMVEVNLMGPIHVIEAFVPPLVHRGQGGHLVNVSSAAGLLAFPWHAAYSASKFGIRGVSEVLRFDLRRHRIGVSLVVPGAVATPLVGTVDIAGIDRDHPSVRRAVGQFESRAVSPEKAAASIIDGIRHNRYMVYTSVDIRIGYWFARKFALPYEVVMRIANDRFDRLARISRATSRRTG